MNKIITNRIKLRLAANSANPGSVGPALAQFGINTVQFSKEFNAATKSISTDIMLPVSLVLYSDKSYKFSVKYPSNTYYFKKLLGIDKGTTAPGKIPCGYISSKEIYELAKVKYANDKTSLESKCKTLISSARSMGIYYIK